jgi:hypothetical protein
MILDALKISRRNIIYIYGEDIYRSMYYFGNPRKKKETWTSERASLVSEVLYFYSELTRLDPKNLIHRKRYKSYFLWMLSL